MTTKKYKGGMCPFCMSTQSVADVPKQDAEYCTILLMDVRCEDCGKTWKNQYHLLSVITHEEGTDDETD
jgi:hypothetical protein